MGKTVESVDKGKRVTIDLTAAATEEVDRLVALTGLSIAALFRNALTLLRVYVKARSEGKEVRIIDPANPSTHVILELPMSIASSGGK